MTRRVIITIAALALSAGCARGARMRADRADTAARWDGAQVAQLALDIEAAVARAGEEHEDDIAAQIGTELEFGEESVDPAILMGSVDELLAEIPALAELNIDTPEVAAAIRARQLRAPAVRQWKDRGCLGESGDGMLVSLKCPAAEQDPVTAERLSFMIIKENRERRAMYEALIDRNRWGRDRYQQIRRAFAQAHWNLGDPRDFFEEDGVWARKDPHADDPVPTVTQVPDRAHERERERLLEGWEHAHPYEGELPEIAPRKVP